MEFTTSDHVLLSVDGFEAMYDRIRCRRSLIWEGEGAGEGPGHTNAASSTDVTDSAPSLPGPQQAVSPRGQFDDLLDGPDYDRLSDLDELEESRLIHARDPSALRRHAMGGDFAEGRLETFVGSPQKELAGTQNQYVSYLVTTKVGSSACSCSFVFMLPVSNA
jgi:sorting nexin-4